jgi:hypothetical protein
VQSWLRTVSERWAHPVPYQGHSAELRSAWARVSGLRTHYRASGSGEQVVLVHGVSVRYLVPLAGELTSGRTAYVPERGEGARRLRWSYFAWLARVVGRRLSGRRGGSRARGA